MSTVNKKELLNKAYDAAVGVSIAAKKRAVKLPLGFGASLTLVKYGQEKKQIHTDPFKSV